MEDDTQTIGELRCRWHRERGTGALHALLGPADALRHGRLGDEERMGDLGRRQTAHRAQRQRELRGRRERGIAAQEQEQQCVVLVGSVVDVGRGDDCRVRGRERGVGVFASTPRLVAAQLVGQPA